MTAIEQIRNLSKVQIGLGVLIASMSALGGAALGAKLAIDKRGDQLRQEADEVLQKEIVEAKNFYKTLNKKEEFETPEKALKELHPKSAAAAAKALLEYAGEEEIKQKLVNYSAISTAKAENLVEVTKNVFTDSAYVPTEFNYEEELLRRDPDRPYVVTEDEFMEAAPQFEQTSFTYYAGDAVLANMRDETVDGNWDDIIGNDNLMRFGHGSNDENIVYIRNVALELDIEVTRSPGKFSKEVHDFDVDDVENELRHSSRRTKFRSSYDD